MSSENCKAVFTKIRGHSTTTWTKFYLTLTPSPSSGQKWTFYIIFTLCHDPLPPVDFSLTPNHPFIVHVVIECPLRHQAVIRLFILSIFAQPLRLKAFYISLVSSNASSIFPWFLTLALPTPFLKIVTLFINDPLENLSRSGDVVIEAENDHFLLSFALEVNNIRANYWWKEMKLKGTVTGGFRSMLWKITFYISYRKNSHIFSIWNTKNGFS